MSVIDNFLFLLYEYISLVIDLSKGTISSLNLVLCVYVPFPHFRIHGIIMSKLYIACLANMAELLCRS